MTSDDDTGIGLLVYNRPKHTQRVVEGLKRNDIQHLYVFADGPKPDEDADAIEKTRNVVRDIDFCDVDIVERSENYGLERSWIEGYDYVFERHDKAIMLEDDCVPAGDFVDFMRLCLDEYEDDERVMNVQGYSPPIDIPESYPYDIYFTWRSGSWGQGTWSDAWDRFERDPDLLDRIEGDPTLRAKVERAGWDLLPMLRKEIEGQIDSVQIWWSLALALNEGVSINPVKSRIKNIGHDGSGTHSPDTDRYTTEVDAEVSLDTFSFPSTITANDTINERYNDIICADRRGKIAMKMRQAKRSLLRSLGLY